ncbi:MAG TPA: methyltransferase domain-containing protein [Candidatus Acidoferrales bacterium]|jgi:SAM-dependent methyltransferase|nr:methyltransferase domain-containing protein [Candidatus Acidoferrales bacterium]
MPDRIRTRELAAEFIRKGDPLGWFEALYQEAERGDGTVPWGDQETNPRLLEFWKTHPLETAGKRAVVIGSGLGDDAEQLAVWGFRTTGFDISKTAIEATKKRYPETRVEYIVGDLFHPPANWLYSFDFVLEVYTVQALPAQLRSGAIERIAQFVAPGGRLLAIARGRAEDEPEGQGPPWPLTRAEIDGFRRAGLEEDSFEDYTEPEPPWVRRYLALYRRASKAS